MGKLKAHRLVDEIQQLQKELRRHQNKCKHKSAKKVAQSNTGNYDPSADRYWYDCKCPTCLRFYTEPQ